MSITVDQPENSNRTDWQEILVNLSQDSSETTEITADFHSSLIPPDQETKYQRILAYAIQISNPDRAIEWSEIHFLLQRLGLDESIDRLVKDLDADVATTALSQAASIALLDRQVNLEEYQVNQTLLDARADNCR